MDVHVNVSIMRRGLLYLLSAIFFGLIVVFVIVVCLRAKENNVQDNSEKDLTSYINTLVKTNTIDSTLKKGVLFIKFFNPDCSFCRKEFDETVAISVKYPNVKFLFFYPNELPFSLRSINNPQIILVNVDMKTYKKFGNTRKPRLYVYKDFKFLLKSDGYFTVNSLLPRFSEKKN